MAVNGILCRDEILFVLFPFLLSDSGRDLSDTAHDLMVYMPIIDGDILVYANRS